MTAPFPFRVDEDCSDETYLYVDMPEGTVVIKRDDEGISLDVYPLRVVDTPVVSTWVLYSEINQHEEVDYEESYG